MASKLKLTELLYPTSTTAAINLAYTGTLTGGTGVVNLGSGQFYKDASGNVGVGTTTPASKFQVNGALRTGGVGANAALAVYTESTGISIEAFQDNTPATKRDIYLAAFGGNVGIGTSSPVAKLDINGSVGIANRSLKIKPSANGADIPNLRTVFIEHASNDGTLSLGFSTSTDAWVVSSTYGSTGAYKPLVFATSDVEKMRLDTSGNLLVGTVTSGSSRFVVSGNGSSNRVAKILGNTAGDVGTAGMLISKFDNNNSTSQVFLQFSINNDTIANGQINGNGANAAAFGTWSDARLKQNIVDLPSQLANICALRPVEFDYIESEGGGHQTGFVAQEIHNIYPDAVGKRSDGMLTVTGWSKTEARLVKAIQEQQALITNLTTRLTALEGN